MGATEKQKQAAIARYNARRSIVDSLKRMTPCADCGQNFPPECMDFDHIQGEKKFNISAALLKGISDLEQEIAKCEIVCANCHRIRTKARANQV